MKELTLNMGQNICCKTKNTMNECKQKMSGLMRNAYQNAGCRFNRQGLNQDSATFWS